MDFVDVPVVFDPDTRIEQCIKLLTSREVGALVNLSGKRPEIVFMRRLMEGLDNKSSRISQISGYLAQIVSRANASSFGISPGPPSSEQGQYLALFNSQRMQAIDFVVTLFENPDSLRSSGRPVTVVTRHEGLGAAIRTSGGYQCNGTNPHYFPDPHVSEGQYCPESPACSRPDGTTPTIVRRY